MIDYAQQYQRVDNHGLYRWHTAEATVARTDCALTAAAQLGGVLAKECLTLSKLAEVTALAQHKTVHKAISSELAETGPAAQLMRANCTRTGGGGEIQGSIRHSFLLPDSSLARLGAGAK